MPPLESQDEPVDAIALPESVRPRLPGPGIFGTVLYMLILVATGAGLPWLLLRYLDPRDAALLGISFWLCLGTGTAFATVWLVVALRFGRSTRRIIAIRGFSLVQGLLIVLLVVPLILVASEVTRWASLVLPGAEELRVFELVAVEASWVTILFASCLLPGLGEESYLRGLVGRGLVARYGVVLGVILTSICFGAMHLNAVQGVAAFVYGLFLHHVYLTTKSLLAPALAHAANNALAFGLMRWTDSTLGGIDLSGKVAIPPLLFVLSLAMIVTLGLVFYETRTRWVLRDGEEWSPGYVTAEIPPPELGATGERDPPAVVSGLMIVLVGMAFLAALAGSA